MKCDVNMTVICSGNFGPLFYQDEAQEIHFIYILM